MHMLKYCSPTLRSTYRSFVDLVGARAWHYNRDRQSDLVEMPEQIKDRETGARRELLESLADFDDGLLEQMLEDKVPAPAEIYEQLGRDLAEYLIVPVLFGSAEQGHGITRLWKALRQEAPQPADRKSTRINSSHSCALRMQVSA